MSDFPTLLADGTVLADDFEEKWQRSMDVMLTAQVRLIRAALPLLERSGEGRIVNIASTEGIGGSAFIAPYTASKHGVIGLTRSLAVELGPFGVTVNAVCPGPIHTGMTAGIDDEGELKQRLRQQKRDSFRACYDEQCQIALGRELAAQKSLSTQIARIGSQCMVMSALYDLKRATSERSASHKTGCTQERDRDREDRRGAAPKGRSADGEGPDRRLGFAQRPVRR